MYSLITFKKLFIRASIPKPIFNISRTLLFCKLKMAEKYVGKYDRISEQNYEDLLKELNVSFILRKAALASNPVFEVMITRSFCYSFVQAVSIVSTTGRPLDNTVSKY